MPRSRRSPRYDRFCELLVKARRDAGLTQVDVAQRLDRPQSFVSKAEAGERRLDVVELLELAEALAFDASEMMQELARVPAWPSGSKDQFKPRSARRSPNDRR